MLDGSGRLFLPDVDAIASLIDELDYGGYEGRSTADIRRELGYHWTVFEHGVTPGASPGSSAAHSARCS